MENFSIRHQLTLPEYRRIYYGLLYRKIYFLAITVLAISIVISSVVFYFTKTPVFLKNEYFSFFQFVIPFIAIWTPLVSLGTVRNVYEKNYRIHESINYEFSPDGIKLTGESFKSESDWTKIYKVEIFKKYLVVYQSSMGANMIKTDTNDEENINSLKEFLKNGNFKLN